MLNRTDNSGDATVYEVPSRLRQPGAARYDPAKDYVKFVGLEDLFPGTGLANLFNTSADFRKGLRAAMRDDLFVSNERFSDEVNAKLKDMGSSLMVSWSSVTDADSCPKISQVLDAHDIQVEGELFMQTISQLCHSGTVTTESLIDIVTIGRTVTHSWHQDSGQDQVTVMFGFPPVDDYSGPGVFSHCVKLSHALVQPGNEGEVIEWERYQPYPGDIPEENIIRPIYRKGSEIMVYNDAAHLHSAPDSIHRESVWRFM